MICTPANLGRTLLIKNGNARYTLSRLDEDGRFAELYEVDRDLFGAWEYEVVERLFVLREETPRPICIPENVGKTLVEVATGRRWRVLSVQQRTSPGQVRVQREEVPVHLVGGEYAAPLWLYADPGRFRLADDPAPVTCADCGAEVIGAHGCQGVPGGFSDDETEPAPPTDPRLYVPPYGDEPDPVAPPTPPPKPHRFDNPYLVYRGRRQCVDCGLIPLTSKECVPRPGWREELERETAAMMLKLDEMGRNFRAGKLTIQPPDKERPEPHAPSISGLGAIACRMSGRRR